MQYKIVSPALAGGAFFNANLDGGMRLADVLALAAEITRKASLHALTLYKLVFLGHDPPTMTEQGDTPLYPPLPAGDILLCFALTLGVWTLTQGAFISSPYIVCNDVPQQVFWMQRFQDPTLYPPDIMNEYARSYVSWGVRGVYYAVSPWIDAIRFSKILTAFTYLASGLLLFLLGGRLGGRAAAWASTAMLWIYPLPMHNMAGGLARSFALPLTLLFLVACVRRERTLMYLALLLQALFIPYIFPACALAVCVPCVFRFFAQKAGKNPPVPIFALNWRDIAVMGAAFLLILAWQHQMTIQGFGPLPTAAQLAADPVYGATGRFRIWPIPMLLEDLFFTPSYYLLGMQNWSTTGHVLGVTVFSLFFLFCLRKAQKRTGELAIYLWYALACLCMYVLAYVLALRLFIPSRQVEYAVDAAVCLLFGLGLGLVWQDACKRVSPRRAQALSVLLVCLLALAGSARLHRQGLTDYSEYAPLYSKVRSLPEDALLAGHPTLMDAVHTFGRRNVLASKKLAHPWSLGYWKRYEPRLRDSLDALYAKDPQTLVGLREQYGVTHFIVIDSQLADWFIQDIPFFDPYNDYIRKLAARPGAFLLAPGGPLSGTEVQPGVRIIPLADIPVENPARAPWESRSRASEIR